MHFYYLGTLSENITGPFKTEILKLKNKQELQYIQFTNELSQLFSNIFSNTALRVQQNNGLSVQKAFYTAPGVGSRIHKDGVDCKSMLNICLASNSNDWIRWYDDSLVSSISKSISEYNPIRNTSLNSTESLPYIDEYRPKTGDVYIVNTDVYHGFRCHGPESRIVMQTKFEGNPDIGHLVGELSVRSFYDLHK